MSTDAQFDWCDLSTFRPAVTEAFYSALFGWSFEGDPDYRYAMLRGRPVGCVFPMPEKFREIGMPFFWMSYVAVPDIARTAELARDAGGKVEIEEEDFALIRDPLGAGFSVHRGAESRQGLAMGERGGNGYFCSDLFHVTGFYGQLFGWRFVPQPEGFCNIETQGGVFVATALELPDELRGQEQYWAVQFLVDDLPSASAAASEMGGSAAAQIDLPEGKAVLIRDPDGAAFFVKGA